ncbi:hypothetical protein JR316_0005724 [Psilocybe cubensis]|uniref:Uncharacterized protein n=2 Tax=Psilocybe cubensis TaxID=181762 RepID=A0A8H8CLP1_PSICU|nr:hypothetical protein JR316_0005724 [Psilocybe cubensis]KAH9481204.1 hypothetical protein JR316_0005724 [Psilocybe cubensis]
MPSITIPLRLKSVFSSRKSRKGSSSPPISILSASTPVLPLSSTTTADLTVSPVESISSTVVHFSPEVASPPSSLNSSPAGSPRVESRRPPPPVERSSKPAQAKVPYRSRSQMLPMRSHQQNAFEYIRVPTLPGVRSLLAPWASAALLL